MNQKKIRVLRWSRLKNQVPNGRPVTFTIQLTPRPFVTIKVKLNDSDPTDQVVAAIKSRDVKDAIVKVLIDVPDGGSPDTDLGKIRTALKPAFTIAAISKNMQRTTRQNLGETVSELTVPEALNKYFIAKNFALPRAKHLSKLAEELINDSN